jgi:hypothetical protein
MSETTIVGDEKGTDRCEQVTVGRADRLKLLVSLLSLLMKG